MLASFVEGDVADQLRLAVLACHAGDADVDHHRARLDPVAADQPRRAGRGDDDVGARGTISGRSARLRCA